MSHTNQNKSGNGLADQLNKLKHDLDQLEVQAIQSQIEEIKSKIIGEIDPVKKKNLIAQARQIVSNAVSPAAEQEVRNLISRNSISSMSSPLKTETPIVIQDDEWRGESFGTLTTDELLKKLNNLTIIDSMSLANINKLGGLNAQSARFMLKFGQDLRKLNDEEEIEKSEELVGDNISLPEGDEAVVKKHTEFKYSLLPYEEAVQVSIEKDQLMDYIVISHESILQILVMLYFYIEILYDRYQHTKLLQIMLKLQNTIESYHRFDPYSLLVVEERMLPEVVDIAEAVSGAIEILVASDGLKIPTNSPTDSADGTVMSIRKKKDNSVLGNRIKKKVFINWGGIGKKLKKAFDPRTGGIIGMGLNRIDAEKKKNADRVAQIKKQQKTISSLNREKSNLQTKIDALNIEQDSLEEDNQAKKEEILRLTQDVSNLNGKIVELDEKVAELAEDRISVLQILNQIQSNGVTLADNLSKVPPIDQLKNQIDSINLFNISNPVEVISNLAEYVEIFANASHSAIASLLNVCRLIGYNAYTNKYGSYATITRNHQILRNITSKMNRFIPDYSFSDLSRPTLKTILVRNRFSISGDLAYSEFVSNIAVPPLASMEIKTSTSRSTKETRTETHNIVDSETQQVRDQFNDALETVTNEESDVHTEKTTEHDTTVDNNNTINDELGGKVKLWGGAVEAGGGRKELTTLNTNVTDKNHLLAEESVKNSLETTANVTKESIVDTNTLKKAEVTTASEKQVEENQEEGIVTTIKNANPSCSLNLTSFQPIQMYYLCQYINNAYIVFTNKIEQVSIPISMLTDFLPKVMRPAAAERILSDIKKNLMLEDVAGRFFSLWEEFKHPAHDEPYLRIKKDLNYLKLLLDGGHISQASHLEADGDIDKEYYKLYEHIPGILMRVDKIPVLKEGLIQKAMMDDGVALDFIMQEEYEQKLERGRIDIDVMREDLRSTELKNNGISQTMAKLDANSGAKFLAMMYKDNTDIMGNLYITDRIEDENDKNRKLITGGNKK